ncbi:glycine--tRNA ligase [Candidatus Woesebacteria bacterium]|nr:glycine--tRNA ligase [Candidatus Woesebacteria bacterium]
MATFDDIVALMKRRGFVYPGSEIYGGLANTYDYGPAGAELLRNIKNVWWTEFVHKRLDMVGIDASLISHHGVWDASGHTSGFSDALIDCKKCKRRMRADHLAEDFLENVDEKVLSEKKLIKVGDNPQRDLTSKKVEGFLPEEFDAIIKQFSIPCPNCKAFEWTPVRKFNLLFPVKLGIVEGDQSLAYLRGETAQGMFINFKNVLDSTRVKLPFGIAQVGKSFRNEITLGNSVFRTIEFEQGEIEYFFDPKKSNWETLFEDWKKAMWEFVTERLGVKQENLRWREHSDEERSFYSTRTEDLEYKYAFGFKELWGLAYRTNYDLSQHIKHSGKDLSVLDPQTNERIVPHAIEPAVGINRLFLMVLSDAYWVDEEKKRTVLRLAKNLAPYKAAVFPLVSNKEEIVSKAKEVYALLAESMRTAWDDRGNIGKRYLSQDEIGTPACITVDYQTLEDQTVTVRDRDSAEQKRVAIAQLIGILS